MPTLHRLTTGARALLPSLLLLIPQACDRNGKLVLSLDLPTNPRLDPTLACQDANVPEDCAEPNQRLSLFGLSLSTDDTTTNQEARILDRSQLSLGRVPAGASVTLRLSAESFAGDILGFGVISEQPIRSDRTTVISVPLRKPLTYLPTPSEVAVIDPMIDLTQPRELPSLPISSARLTAATHDGTLLFVATATELYAYGTDTHEQRYTLPLPDRPAGLAFDPTNSYGLLATQSSLYRLSLSAPALNDVQLPIGGVPGPITFSPDGGTTAWMLIDPADFTRSCNTLASSTLIRITNLDSTSPQTEQRTLPGPAAAIAFAPSTGKLILSFPCSNTLAELSVENLSEKPRSLLTLPSPYDFVVTNERLVVITADNTTNLAQVVIVPLDETPVTAERTSTTTFSVPPIDVPVGREQASSGSFRWLWSPQNDFVSYKLAATPRGQRALTLYRVSFRSNIDTPSCNYSSDAVGTGYLIIDLANGSVLLNQLTDLTFNACSANCLTLNGQALTNTALCVQAIRQELLRNHQITDQAYVPEQPTLLFDGS